MSHINRLLTAADMLHQMAADIPYHSLLDNSTQAIARRAAKAALLDKVHEIRNAVAEAADADLTESD